MKRLKRFLPMAMLALLAMPATAPHAQQAETTAEPAGFRIPVTAVSVKVEPVSRLSRVQGVIEAIDAPEIKSKVAAEVVEVLVDEGDEVSAGQVLAHLDDEGFRLDKQAAEADIQRLQAVLDVQRRTLKRDESLFSQKLISDAKLDDSRAAVKQTRAQLAHARSLLAKAAYQLSHTRVASPIPGIVQSRPVSRGDYVNPNSPNSKTLFQVVDTHRLRARLYFPENQARLVNVGTPVELVKNNDRVATRIGILRPMLETGTHAQQALAAFDNRNDWRPGESITAIAELARHDKALVVPESVLVRRPAGLVVYRLHEGKAQEVAVTTGIRQGDRVEITEGLAAGDTLALEGASYLSDGVAVEIKGDAR